MTKERRSPKPDGVECAEAAMRDGCRWPLCDCDVNSLRPQPWSIEGDPYIGLDAPGALQRLHDDLSDEHQRRVVRMAAQEIARLRNARHA